ncbi:MAG: hypothetical protein Q7U24_09800 [Sulfurimicrobium sp.]|nr:hypothetical protein [Sulfurimicrobium sp.]
MHRPIALLILAALSLTAPVAHSETRMDVGASIVNGDVSGFYFALGDYYRVPEREVMLIRERRIPDYDIPVVLFISQRAHVAPGVIMDLRLSGRSWMDITLHFGLGPDIYYIPVKQVYGPPYGHAYGHYKNKQRKDWHKIRLNDHEVVDMVNLRFMSEHYGRPPEEVMRMRSGGKSFAIINDEYRRGKPGKEYRERDQYQEQRMDRRQDQRQDQRQDRRMEQRDIRDQRNRDRAGPDDRPQRGNRDQSSGRESKGQGRDNGDGHPGKGRGRDKDE